MLIIKPDFYDEFSCIAGACPDSCCARWEVDVDKESQKKYKTLTGDIRKRIDSSYGTDEFGNTVFSLTPGLRCPFLNSDNLCDLHIATSQEFTPATCRMFPRFRYDFGSRRELGLSMSCPVVANSVWNRKSLIAFTEMPEDIPIVPNDIDPQLFFKILSERKSALKILCSDDSLKNKMLKIADMSSENEPDAKSEKINREGAEKRLLRLFDNDEIVSAQWKAIFKGAKFCREKGRDILYVNLMIYILHKYLMLCALDHSNDSSVLKLAAVVPFVSMLFGNTARSFQLWSKETEHSDKNMARIWNLLSENSDYSSAALKQIISLLLSD